ncbi:MAG TPA: hypothetical protein VHF90_06840, partial [Thermoleophilaceae bacterium]|nr:hypothetical protein [Thermoleophilaceae bacterium]
MTSSGPIACADQSPPVLRFQRPSLPSGEAIEQYLGLAREARWFSNGGPCWQLLRDRLSDRVGAYCVPVASGTIGLMAAGVDWNGIHEDVLMRIEALGLDRHCRIVRKRSEEAAPDFSAA